MSDTATDNPLTGMLQFARKTDAERQESFQSRCVKSLLRHAAVTLDAATRRAAVEAYGDLTFQWLTETYPFPMRLAASKLQHTSGTKVGWTELFGSGFMQLPWVREYRSVCELHGWDPRKERCGLIFNAPHTANGTLMVLHNQPSQADGADGGLADADRRETTWTRVVRPYGRDHVVYVLEQLESFCETIGKEWAQCHLG